MGNGRSQHHPLPAKITANAQAQQPQGAEDVSVNEVAAEVLGSAPAEETQPRGAAAFQPVSRLSSEPIGQCTTELALETVPIALECLPSMSDYQVPHFSPRASHYNC